MTALRVLVAVDPAIAAARAGRLGYDDASLRGVAAALLTDAAAARGDSAALERRAQRRTALAALGRELLAASDKSVRAGAARTLGDAGDPVAAGSALRAAWRHDVAAEVREAAAAALARLGDAEAIDELIAALRGRAASDGNASAAALALGDAGDARGVAALLDAFRTGWRAATVGEALRRCSGVALQPLLDLVEQEPRLAERKPSRQVVAVLPEAEVVAALAARLDALRGQAAAFDRVALYLELAADAPHVARGVARIALEVLPEASTRAEKTVARAVAKAAERPG